MDMNNISFEELVEVIEKQNAAFLCGNGFSMNFDDVFSNIYDRLYEAHRILIRYGEYSVKANNKKFSKVFIENYRSVVNYLRSKDKKYFEKVFQDGILFANSIISNPKLISELRENSLLQMLVFGNNMIDLVEDISKVKEYKKVNIEYWTILIYIYFAILKINSTNYEFSNNNEFIFLIRLGYQNKNPIIDDKNFIEQYVLSNGFNTYYRMLFCTAIWAKGKATDFSLLEKVDELNIDCIKQFLTKFESCMTLNYDWLLNYLYENAIHLHGRFTSEKEFVWCQSLGLNFIDKGYISFSDILIGDYYNNKIKMGLIQSNDKSEINKKVNTPDKIIDAFTKKYEIEVFVIFGMCIDNDQHILRSIMVSLANENICKAKIIYCNFSENDLENFLKQYNNCMTFSNELCEKVKKIEVLNVRTKEILEKCFLGDSA